MGARRALIEFVGDARSLLASLKRSGAAVDGFQVDLKELAVTAQKTAAARVQASVKSDARLRQEIIAYQQLASAARRGSAEQRAAADLAAKAQLRLAGASATSAREARELSASAAKAGVSLGRETRGALAGSGIIAGMGRSIAFASSAFLGAAGLVYGLKASVQAAAAFDTALHQMQGLAAVSAKQTAAWGKQLLALGPQVAKGPVELAQALYFVASAGIKGGKAIDVVRVAAKAATAGLGQTQVVADALSSAVNAYGQANLSAARAGDVLVATVREGKAEASQIAPVLGNILPIAAKLGVKFHDVGAAIAAMTRVGFNAPTAATNLSAIFNTLLKNAPKSAAAFAAVGLSAAGLRKELAQQGLLAMLETLKQRFGDNVTAMAQAFPNIRALRGVFTLLGKNTEATAGIFDRMAHTTGALGHAFQVALKDPATRFAAFKAGLQSTAIELGSALMPAVLKVTNAMTSWLGKTKNQQTLNAIFKDGVHAITVAAGAAAAVLGPVAKAADKVAHAVGGWKTTLELAAGGWVGFKAAAIASAAATATANLAAAGVVSTAWKAALISTGFGALAVAAGVAAAYVVTHWKQVKSFFATVGHDIVYAFEYAWYLVKKSAIEEGLAIVKTFDITILGHHLIPGVHSAVTAMQNALNKLHAPNLAPAFGNAGRRAGQAFVDQARAAIENLKPGTIIAAHRAGPRGQVQGAYVAPGGSGGGGGGGGSSSSGGAGGGGGGGASGFSLPMRLQLEEAKAQASGVQRQIVAAARDVKAYILQAIASGKLHGKALLDAYNALASANSELAGAAKKAGDAAKKAADSAKKAKEAYQNAFQQAEQQIGQLFQGPILAPTTAETQAQLGVPAPDPKTLVKDLNAQTAAYRAWLHDLHELAKRGAPKQLISELRAEGPDDAAQVHALATASGKVLREFFKAFAARENTIRHAASMTVRSPKVTVHAGHVSVHGPGGGTIAAAAKTSLHLKIDLNGKQIAAAVLDDLQRKAKRQSTQRRGRHPGVNLALS